MTLALPFSMWVRMVRTSKIGISGANARMRSRSIGSSASGAPFAKM
jgi:hypothetical protein